MHPLKIYGKKVGLYDIFTNIIMEVEKLLEKNKIIFSNYYALEIRLFGSRKKILKLTYLSTSSKINGLKEGADR